MHLERLLKDTNLCILSIPYLYGEVRYLAAYALWSEYRLMGISESISLADVVIPLDYTSIWRLAESVDDVREDGPVLEVLGALRDRGLVPVVDIAL